MTPDISICIATFRRPRGLARLLDSLDRLVLPEALSLEIIVVDNDPSGDPQARELAARESAQAARWFIEPRQNIALARNRALKEARGRFVAFIDDDEVADENWLGAFLACAERGDADGFFGPVLPRLDEVATPWLDLETFFARPRHPSGSRLDGRQVSTNNALVRRSLFADQRFDPAWGRTGGSDSELFDRLLAAGACFRWCDEAMVWEVIPASRHRLGWLARRAFRGGVAYTRLQERGRRSAAARWRFPRSVFALAVLVPLLPLALLAGRSAAARVWLRICTQAGHLWAMAGRSYEEYGDSAAKLQLE